MRTRVKICGITRHEDAAEAARLGVDAIGLVFYPPSPRAINVRQAALIVAGLAPFVSVVALFVDASKARVEQVLAGVPIDLLQFHGAEKDAFCASFGRPFIKAIGVQDRQQLSRTAALFPHAGALLLDSFHVDLPGGSGKKFDWAEIPPLADKPIVLAGGLDSANVSTAIKRIQPYAVDISSGVEKAKGQKDWGMMQAFVAAVSKAGNLV